MIWKALTNLTNLLKTLCTTEVRPGSSWLGLGATLEIHRVKIPEHLTIGTFRVVHQVMEGRFAHVPGQITAALEGVVWRRRERCIIYSSSRVLDWISFPVQPLELLGNVGYVGGNCFSLICIAKVLIWGPWRRLVVWLPSCTDIKTPSHK